MAAAARPSALIRVPGQGWLSFRRPAEIFVAHAPDDVENLLGDLRQGIRAVGAAGNRRWAVGFFSYEATPAFDPAFTAHPPQPGVPVAWWALFDAPQRLAGPPAPSVPSAALAKEQGGLDWRPAVTRQEHATAVEEVRRLIAAGDTYQVNLTFPLEARMGPATDPYRLLLDWIDTGETYEAGGHPSPYAAWIDTGAAGCSETDLVVASASPELFFSLRGDRVLSRPMKGTSPRGRWWREDEEHRAELLSEKNRAENLMIADMLRNDLGRVAVPGTVRVTRLFGIETYATVHQLTSEVSARLEPGRDGFDVLRALFPCASVTGAPKARTSHIIRALEPQPRGVYTGSAGYFAPDGSAQLSVLIRTALFDRCQGVARYGTGGGVVWDSRAEGEFDEARTKTRILRRRNHGQGDERDFRLLETMLWRPGCGFFLLLRHLRRLADSARFFDFAADPAEIERRMRRLAAGWTERTRVRLLVDRCGVAEIQSSAEPCPRPGSGRPVARVVLDDRPIDDHDVFLFHKTTRRAVYEDAAARHPGADDVILWNDRGEVTESMRANLIVERDGRRLTPPRRCGLLAGTFRQALLDRGSVEECVLTRHELATADRLLLVNSVRGLQPMRLVEGRGAVGRSNLEGPRNKGTVR